MTSETEIIPGLSFSEYVRLPGINSHSCKAGLTSMRHMHRQRTAPIGKDSPSMRFGRLMHASILEPERFDSLVTVWTGGVRRGKLWEAFKAENDPEWIVTAEEHARLGDMRAAIEGHDYAKMILGPGDAEVVIRWQDRTYGWAKARIDKCCSGWIYDIKTTSYIERHAFARQAERLHYFDQFGWYAHGYEIAAEQFSQFMVVAVESDPPYDVVAYEVPKDLLHAGYETYAEIARQYHTCTQINQFPGISSELLQLERPGAWSAMDELDTTGINEGVTDAA
jgi:hypothetical protein